MFIELPHGIFKESLTRIPPGHLRPELRGDHDSILFEEHGVPIIGWQGPDCDLGGEATATAPGDSEYSPVQESW